MKCAIVVKMAAAAVVVAGLAGCQDLKPLQADIDTLKGQVSKLQSDLSAAQSSACGNALMRTTIPALAPGRFRA